MSGIKRGTSNDLLSHEQNMMLNQTHTTTSTFDLSDCNHHTLMYGYYCIVGNFHTMCEFFHFSQVCWLTQKIKLQIWTSDLLDLKMVLIFQYHMAFYFACKIWSRNCMLYTFTELTPKPDFYNFLCITEHSYREIRSIEVTSTKYLEPPFSQSCNYCVSCCQPPKSQSAALVAVAKASPSYRA